MEEVQQSNEEKRQKEYEREQKPWYYFILGVLFIITLWLTAKVFAWLVPGFRSFYNRIFVVNSVTNL